MDEHPKSCQPKDKELDKVGAVANWMRCRQLICLLTMLSVAIFVGELAITVGLSKISQSWGVFQEGLIDSLLLVLILFPVIYYVFFRPMKREITGHSQTENKLLESLKRETVHRETLDAVFEAAPIGLFLIDDTYNIKRINKSAGHVVQRGSIEIIDHVAGEGLGCFHASVLPGGCGSGLVCQMCPLRQLISRTMQTGEPAEKVDLQTTVLLNGEELQVWFQVNAVRVMLEGRAFIVMTLENITYHRQVDEALRKYRLLAENARDIILFIGLDGQIIEANHAALEAYGYTKEEIQAKKIFDISPLEATDYVYEQMKEAMENGILFETMNRKKNGSMFPVQVSAQGAVINDQRVIMSIARDISERKRMEEAIREERDFSASLILNSIIPTFVIDANHRVLIWNRACEELTGVSAQMVVGTQNHWQGFYPEERPCLADILIDGNVEQLPSFFKLARCDLSSKGIQGEGGLLTDVKRINTWWLIRHPYITTNGS